MHTDNWQNARQKTTGGSVIESITIIPWASTEWSSAERLSGTTPMPIDQTGVAQARTWAAQLANRRLGALWTSDEMTGQQTARCIHDTIGVPVRTLPGIEEVSLGLWEGLKSETLKSRFPKVYKRWLDNPTAICPPNGESLESASQRIESTLVRAIRKARQKHIGVVLGPMAAAVLRCVLEGEELASVRSQVPDDPCDYEIQLHDGKLAGQSPAVSSSNR